MKDAFAALRLGAIIVTGLGSLVFTFGALYFDGCGNVSAALGMAVFAGISIAILAFVLANGRT